MSAKARITADFATPSDVASRLRIPAARAAELRRQVIDLQYRKADGSMVLVEFKAPRASSSRKIAKAHPGDSERSKKK
jgi:hypothetical protein